MSKNKRKKALIDRLKTNKVKPSASNANPQENLDLNKSLSNEASDESDEDDSIRPDRFGSTDHNRPFG